MQKQVSTIKHKHIQIHTTHIHTPTAVVLIDCTALNCWFCRSWFVGLLLVAVCRPSQQKLERLLKSQSRPQTQPYIVELWQYDCESGHAKVQLQLSSKQLVEKAVKVARRDSKPGRAVVGADVRVAQLLPLPFAAFTAQLLPLSPSAALPPSPPLANPESGFN